MQSNSQENPENAEHGEKQTPQQVDQTAQLQNLTAQIAQKITQGNEDNPFMIRNSSNISDQPADNKDFELTITNPFARQESDILIIDDKGVNAMLTDAENINRSNIPYAD